MDLPAQRPQLGQFAGADRGHGATSGSTSRGQRQRQPAPERLHGLWLGGAVGCAGRPGAGCTAGPALPARRALQRRRLGAAHAAHARTGLSVLAIDYRGFGKSSKQLALRSVGARRRARRLALAGRAASGAAALHLRPLAGRRHRHRPGVARDGRERHHRRRHLHLHRRRGQQLQVGLAAVPALRHAALRRARSRAADRLAAAGGAWRRTTA